MCVFSTYRKPIFEQLPNKAGKTVVDIELSKISIKLDKSQTKDAAT